MDPQVFFGGLVREITYEQSNGRHGIVGGEGRVRLVRYGSIAKTLQRAKLGFQRIEFEPKHVPVCRPAGRLQLRLRLRHRQLQRRPPLGPFSLLRSQRRSDGSRRPRVILLRFDRFALPTPCHRGTVPQSIVRLGNWAIE